MYNMYNYKQVKARMPEVKSQGTDHLGSVYSQQF